MLRRPRPPATGGMLNNQRRQPRPPRIPQVPPKPGYAHPPGQTANDNDTPALPTAAGSADGNGTRQRQTTNANNAARTEGVAALTEMSEEMP